MRWTVNTAALLLLLAVPWAQAQTQERQTPAQPPNELQALIDAAAPGSVLRLEPRTYPGNVLIEKPLRIVGRPGTTLQGDRTATVVSIRADDVTLDTLRITGSGKDRSSYEEHAGVRVRGKNAVLSKLELSDNYHGIFLNASQGTTIKDCTIVGELGKTLGARGNGINIIRAHGNHILNNSIARTRDGIGFEYADDNEIHGNHITQTRYGLHYMYSNRNTFTGNDFSGNVGGAAIMLSEHITLKGNKFSFNQGSRAFGVIIQAGRDIEVLENEFHLNQRGLFLEQSTNNRIEKNSFFRNQIGVELWSNSTAHVFKENVFSRNNTDAVLVGGQGSNAWFENGVGNYWNRPVLDLDQNGVGDVPLSYESALGNLIRQNELAYLFISSPAIQIYEMTSQLFSGGESAITDQFPLLEQPTSRAWIWPALLLAAGLPLLTLALRKRR